MMIIHGGFSMATRSADKTTELLEKRFQKSPSSRVFSRLADAHRKEGNINRAIELCMSGIQSHPDYITGHLILGRCYYEQENYNGAFDEFKTVCSVDRHNQIAIKMLADIFVHQGMKQKAGSLYAILSKIDPFNKSLEKLTSQYQPDKITDLFEILGIESPGEQVIWEPSQEQSITEQKPFDDQFDTDLSEDQSLTEQFPVEQISDNTVAIDGDAISQQLSSIFDDESSSGEQQGEQPFFEDSTTDNNSLVQEITTDSIIDESTDITGQDISSRIDELFSEPTDSSGSSVGNSLPELFIEDDDTTKGLDNVSESTASIDHGDFSSLIEDKKQNENTDSEESDKTETLTNINDQDDLILERTSTPDAVDPFTGENALSEFEETMQFDKSFLDNVMGKDDNQTTEEAQNSSSQSLFEQAKDDLEINEIPSLPQPSESDFFSKDNLQELIDSPINTIDSPGNGGIDELKPEPSLIAEQSKDDSDFQNLDLSLSEELNSGSDSDAMLTDEAIVQKKDDFLIPDPQLQDKPELEIKNEHSGAFSGDENNDFQLQGTLPELPQIENDIELIVPDNESEKEQIENPNSESEVWEQLPEDRIDDNPELQMEPFQQSAEESDSTGNYEDKNHLPGTFQDDLEVVDISEDKSELDQLSVEHGDDVLTDMDVLVSDEEFSSVSGNDIIEKMDALFPDEKTVIDSGLKNNETVIEKQNQPVKDQQLIEDVNLDVVSDEPAAETNSSEMTDPFENPSLEPQQSSIETDEPCSLENTVNSDSTSDFADSDQDEMCDIISGEDVKDRLDQFFPSDNLISNSSAGMIPPDNNESEDDLSDFYTIFGDSAENGQPVDDLSGLEQIEMEIPSETETPVSFYDEWNDVCSMQDQNESEEKGPKEKILKTDIQSKKTIPETNSQSDEQQNQSRPYTIPDHVLTPTLADIYFQQGQSDLAIQIYTRLLSRDPENENLQQRLQQVKMTAETGVFNSDYKVVTDDSQKTVSENSAAKKKKIVVDNRPLAGVRIKKRKTNGGTNLKAK